MNSKRPLIIGLALAAAIVVIALVVVIILVLTRVPLKSAHDVPKLMPADTGFYASMTVDLQDVVGFKHLVDIFGDIPEVEDLLDEIQDGMDDEFGITWEDDVEPWLGSEIGVGIADLESAMESGEPVLIAAASTRNRKESDRFIEKVIGYFGDDDYYDVQDEEYQGVEYWIAQPDSDWDMPVILGTVGKFVVLTSDENAMEDVIDAQNRKIDTLDQADQFKDLSSALPSGAVLYAYVNLKDIMGPMVDEMRSEAEYELGIALPDYMLDVLEALETAGYSVSLDKEGIQLDVAVTFDPDDMPQDVLEGMSSKPTANRILKRIPADSLGFFSGQNLAGGWQTIYDALLDLEDAEQQIEDFSDEIGIDITRDLFDWLSGEFAVAVIGARGIEDIPVGGIAVMEVDDESEASDTLESFFDALEEYGDVELDQQDYDGVDMQLVIDPYSEDVIVGYGFKDKNLLIGIFEDSLEEVAARDLEPLSDDPTFRAVQSHLPRGNSGYYYINLENVLDLVTDAMDDWSREDYEDYVAPWVEPIKAVGFAGSAADAKRGLLHAALFVYIP